MIDDCLYKDVCNIADTEDCNDSCLRYAEMNNLLLMSNLPKNRWTPSALTPDDCDFEAFCKLADIKDNIKDFVYNGESLYIYSEKTGNGKTTWSIKMLLKYFDSVWAGNGLRCRGLFIHIPTLLNQLKDFENKTPDTEQLRKLIPNVDVVIWDDIASSNLSNYDLSQLLIFIDQRVLCGKSNIFTGNFDFEQMKKYLGSRLASRIWNSSTRIKLQGGDKR